MNGHGHATRPDEVAAPLGDAEPVTALGAEELARRAAEARRLLRDDGVTYHLHDDRSGPGEWTLDPVPLVIGTDAWRRIDAGMAQRAALLDEVLADLCGPQRLLTDGLIAPAAVLDHPGLLRLGATDAAPSRLVLHAADLAPLPGGDVVVLADRTQAPSGAGYALENRLVTSRVLPLVYREARVQRLAPFFRALRAACTAARPEGVDEPRIVIWTPGRWNESSFEHAFLAAQLGWTLVEGADLTVRDGQVWLRALGGLEPVHVIVRRVDAWWCDPLELRADSQLGVPGLVEAVRRGTVSLVNPLGAGVLEDAALLPALPSLCRALLGEDLLLPSVPTWWCGDPTHRQHVLTNLEHLVVKPIGRTAGTSARFGGELSAEGRDELRRRIDAEPHRWVGQERLELATTPTLAGGPTPGTWRIDGRPTLLRSFAVTGEDGWTVLPGGLTRVATSAAAPRISGQLGSASKDTWVVASDTDERAAWWLHRGPEVVPADPAATMPSRAAENLFWLGRYAERAEQTVRLLRVALDRRTDLADRDDPAGDECVRVLLGALTHLTETTPGFVGEGAEARLARPDTELRRLLVDATIPGTLAADVRALLSAAAAVRDQLSSDTWLVVSNLERELTALGLDGEGALDHGATPAALAAMLKSLLAVAGLVNESMVRDAGWRFLDAGRRLERALRLSTLLRTTLDRSRSTAAESLVLESVLTAAESIITYRRRYRSHAQTATVLDLLLLDEGNPRAAAHQLTRLAEDVADMPRRAAARASEEERLVLEASTALRLVDVRALAVADEHGRRDALVDFLDHLEELLSRTGQAIDDAHFTHREPSRPVRGGPAQWPGGLEAAR